MVRLTVAGDMVSAQRVQMADLAEVAAFNWEQEQHPGWSAAGVDSCPLLAHLDHIQVTP